MLLAAEPAPLASRRAQSSGSADSGGGGEGQTLSSLLPHGLEDWSSAGGGDLLQGAAHGLEDVNKHREKNRNAQVRHACHQVTVFA